MNQDNSTQALLFRLRRGIGNAYQELQRHKGYALGLRGQPTKSTRGQVATTLGKRNGVPDGAEQDMFQMQRDFMRRKTTRPFRSNQMEDIVPTIYNGNINILAGTGGAPLAFALDDETELQQRLYSEGIRGSNTNPLSARYAMNAREGRELPVQGGATDIMRRELEGNEDDKETMARKLQSGYLGHNTPFLTSETQVDPEVQAFLDQHRPPTRKDFDGMGTKFQATVQRIGDNTVTHLNNINTQLGDITANGRVMNRSAMRQQGALNDIYNVLNTHGNKFDALLVASQSQAAGGQTSSSLASKGGMPPPGTPTGPSSVGGFSTPQQQGFSSSSGGTAVQMPAGQGVASFRLPSGITVRPSKIQTPSSGKYKGSGSKILFG